MIDEKNKPKIVVRRFPFQKVIDRDNKSEIELKLVFLLTLYIIAPVLKHMGRKAYCRKIHIHSIHSGVS
jgi:hypothetical protein